jgi:hypothetical protein
MILGTMELDLLPENFSQMFRLLECMHKKFYAVRWFCTNFTHLVEVIDYGGIFIKIC